MTLEIRKRFDGSYSVGSIDSDYILFYSFDEAYDYWLSQSQVQSNQQDNSIKA